MAIALGGGLGATFPRLAGAATPPSARGQSYAVSTDQADATRAALDVMARGGNAADGAIAAALALGVVSPASSGIGGGGFALVYSAKDKKVSVLDFRETAPAVYSAEALWPSKSKDSKAFTPNGGVVGVPGEPAGLELLSQRFGRKSLADAAAPAVALAKNGFWVGLHTADQVDKQRARIEAAPSLASVLLPGGMPAAFGSRLRRPDLGATLERFGAEGKRSIYAGPVAEKIASAVQAAGGTMTAKDLAEYEVQERAPLSRTYDGRTIYTMPAPSGGGLMLLEVLGMYGATPESELARLGFGSSAYIHIVAEAMRGAFADIARGAADPDLDRNVYAAYNAALEPAQLAARRKSIFLDKTHKPIEFTTREKGTSHLTVADAEGNIVTLTTTINGLFGAAIVPEGTGIVLNNELEDFTSPEAAAAFGLKDGGPNRPRPKARPLSSMTPTIIVENGRPILALGGSGGPRIATGVTQATLARLLFNLDPAECVSAPRFHTQGADLSVDREVVLDVREALKNRGETVKEEPFGAAIQMIAWKYEGGKPTLFAASDPRKLGFSAAR